MITCKKKSYINTYLITNFKTDFLYLKYIISIKDKSYEVIYIYKLFYNGTQFFFRIENIWFDISAFSKNLFCKFCLHDI